MVRCLKIWIFIGGVLFFLIVSTSDINLFAGNDKLKHFGVSSIFGAASETCLHYKTNLKTSERIILSTALGSLPGFVKELIDSTEKENQFSGGDFVVDIAGAFLGAIVGNFFNNIIQVKIDKTDNNKTVAISLSYRF